MHETVTVGMIVWPLLVLFGAAVALGVLIWVLSIFASGFNH
jgi:hypothetical protein